MELPSSALAAAPVCTVEALLASLHEIFSESLTQVKAREASALHDILAKTGNRCVLFGAGSMGRRALECLRGIGIEPLAIADNNRDIWGTSLQGVPLLFPGEAAARFGRDAVFFITIRNEHHWYRETVEQLTSLGCDHVASAASIGWRFPEAFLPFLLYDLPHKVYEQADQVMLAAQIWEDDVSRAAYLVQVRLRALDDLLSLPKPAAEESYFIENVFDLGPNDVFLDCGAFDGDTIRSLIARYPKIGTVFAVEADARSFASLSAYVAALPASIRDRMQLHYVAVGAERGTVQFQDTGTVGSTVCDTGGTMLDVVPIDELCGATPVAMIKMDIEGAEFDALIGGTRVIRRDHPILAICVYHSQQDLWRLPLLMRKLNPKYRMYLRTYCGDGLQTVAYAVPPDRVMDACPVRPS